MQNLTLLEKRARLPVVPDIAPPLDQATFVSRSIQNKGLDRVPQATAATARCAVALATAQPKRSGATGDRNVTPFRSLR